MLPSGNDAAISLAKWAANLIPVTPFKNSIDTFVARMNRMARLIGLRQSVFANPHGLPHRLGCSNPY
jgi:D-alanyl-D-alanine carboxypeptidase